MEHDDPLYGTVEFGGAVADLLQHPALQRLRGVHQNGGAVLVNPDLDTSRFEHSAGVAALCRRFGASERAVLAAVVHDVGHTAFSHVADRVFDRADQTFHEDQYGRIVDRFDLDDAIEDRGYDPDRVFDAARFPILERDLPGVCADRLDYQLRDCFKYGLLDRGDVETVLSGVTVEDGHLVAADREAAHRLVDVSLLTQRQVFLDARHEAANAVLADVLATALDRGLLTVEDLFRTDRAVLDALRSHDDLAATLDAVGPEMTVTRAGPGAEYVVSRKHRTVDPPVAGTGRRVSDLDPAVARKVERFREHVPDQQGYAVTLPTDA